MPCLDKYAVWFVSVIEAFALFCNKSDLKDFAQDCKKYKRQNWKLLDFREVIKTTEITNKQKDPK